MDTFIPSNIAEALGWTILHSLWQATLIGTVLMLILQLMKNSNASQRYLISLSSLFAILLMAGITFFTIYQPATVPLASAEVITWFEMPTFQETEKTWQYSFTIAMSFLTAYSPQISLVWLLGVTFLSIRFLFSLLYVHQLKTYKVKPASVEWERRLNAIAEKIKTNRQIKLVESALVAVPTVVGWLKPVILLPLGMFASLPPYQIESILAHELAHIHRNDFFINILQSIVEILFFYHPAAWYISKHIENERENCCDDIAVATMGDSLTYIKALTNLASMKTTNLSPALAVTGRKGSLFQRVSRIAQNTNLAKKHTVSPKLTAAMIVIMCLLLLATKTEATTFLDSLVEPFENQENSNNLKDKELALNDTTKKVVKVQKTVTVRFDSLLNDDTTISITTIINKNGKSDTLHNIAHHSNMPFFYKFNEENLTKEFILNSSGDTLDKKFLFVRTSPTAVTSGEKMSGVLGDSLGKIWLHYPNGKNKLLLINDLESFKEFRYLPTDSIFKHLKNLKQGNDFQILNPQDFISTDNPKDRKFWIGADSIGKALPKGGRTYVYKYNAMQNPLVIVNGEGSKFKIGLDENYPLYVIDGEKLPEGRDASLEILRKLNPNDIASMEVFKGEKAIKKYGEQGKNGVIVIKTKKGKKKKSDTSEEINISKDEGSPQPQNFSLHIADPNTQSKGKPLLIINGVTMTQEESNKALKKVNPNDIQSMDILKGASAITLHGEKGKDGVIIIKTKEGKQREKDNAQIGERLYILDGKEVSKEEADSPEIFKNIHTINVIGKSEAMKAYGDKGKNGATVMYTTKTMSKPKPEDISKGIKVTEFEPLKGEEVLVFPNPTQSYVNIRFALEKSEPVVIEVHDTKGQKMATIADGAYLDKGQNSLLWDTAKIPTGTYIITVKRGGRTSQHKLLLD
ncbi:MAG: T9SS C-terminal target domain-containing protein [Cytophagales bacterium]|nr:MAG: T9SS C-terminal target domain-containing protein [Cytophagales bacterium]